MKDLASAADTTMQAQAQTVREALAVASRNCKTIIDGKRSIAGRAALDALVAELDRLRDERDDWRERQQRSGSAAKDSWDSAFNAKQRATKVERELAEARAELERVTRERRVAVSQWHREIDMRMDANTRAHAAEAELVAAAGREQRLRDTAQTVVNALDAYASVGGVDLETLRAVLEEGQQPRPTMAEALDAAGMLRDPEMEEGQP